MIKSLKLLLLIMLGAQSTFAQSEYSENILLEQGTVLKVKALERVNSKKIAEGEEVQFEVYEMVEVNGKVLIKEGTVVKAFVESVDKARGFGKEGYLKIEFVNTTAVDGTKVPLRALRGSILGEDRQENSIYIAAFLGPMGFLKKGGQAKINEGKIMRVNVTKDVYIKVN